MTAQSHTIYTVCLFFALNALMLWTVRRERRIQKQHEQEEQQYSPKTLATPVAA